MITGISWTILYGGCSGKHQDSDISNSFAMWTLWYGGFYSLIKCFKWFCSFTAGRYFSRILVALLCLVGRVNLVWRKGSQCKILFCFWSFAGGRGVAPGVKPEKCTRCKGLGTVSFARKKKPIWRIKIIFTFLTWRFAAYPDFHATGPIYGADYLSSVSWRTGNCAGMLHLSEFTRNH